MSSDGDPTGVLLVNGGDQQATRTAADGSPSSLSCQK